MLALMLVMLFIVVVGAAVVTYVAFPHRGEPVPRAAWLGRAMRRGVEVLPTVHRSPPAPSHRASRST